MEPAVQITDSRPKWMIEEAYEMKCLECPLYKRCYTRDGKDCKRLGGSTIPKIRG